MCICVSVILAVNDLQDGVHVVFWKMSDLIVLTQILNYKSPL